MKHKSRLVNTHFWDDNYTSNLDPIEKLLFLYFLTNPLTNIIGIYEIEIKRIAFDTGIEKEMVLKIIERFSRDEKIYYYDNFIIIKNFVKFQNQQSEKIKSGINKLFDDLPENIKKFNSELLKGIHTVSHYNTNINTNINSNSNNNFNSNFNLKKERSEKKNKKDLPEKSPAEITSENLQNELRKIFEDYYFRIKKTNYYYSGKCAGALKQIINKIKSAYGEKKYTNTDLKNAFNYILKNIRDDWILNNLDLSIVNSKFNQIISNAKNTENRKSFGPAKGFNAGVNDWIAGIVQD